MLFGSCSPRPPISQDLYECVPSTEWAQSAVLHSHIRRWDTKYPQQCGQKYRFKIWRTWERIADPLIDLNHPAIARMTSYSLQSLITIHDAIRWFWYSDLSREPGLWGGLLGKNGPESVRVVFLISGPNHQTRTPRRHHCLGIPRIKLIDGKSSRWTSL